MGWKLRGWLWYVQAAIFRKFGANKSLFSTLFLVVACVISLCIVHITVLGGQGETGLENLKIYLGPSQQYAEEDLAQKETSDYTGVDRLPNSHPKNKNAGPNNKSKMKKNKKKKGFNQNAIGKKDSIGSRKDKLIFPRTYLVTKDKKLPLVINSNKQKHKPQTYQEDIIVGENIEWTLDIEQERRRELRQRSLRVRHECQNDVRGRLNRIIAKVHKVLKWVDRYELVYCPVFKAASTTWMKNLLLLARETRFNGSLHYRVSSLYPKPRARQKIENLLDKSLKFMIVRHPFERILSAYRDKMLRVLETEDPYRMMQLRIMEKYADVGAKNTSTHSAGEEETTGDNTPSSSSDTVKKIDHPSFLQFLYHVRDEMKGFWKIHDGAVVDPHWTPQWYSCAPCQIRYDIIAKVETLDLDNEFIIRAANLLGTIPNARTHASKFDGYSDSESASAEYFKEIPLELLQELEKLYLHDFKLFGYTAEKYFKMAKSGD